MDRNLYIAMSGAKQILLAQASNSNNLANANTTGFRKDLQQFRAMPVYGTGFPSRVYAMSERPAVDFSAGAIQSTGRDLDVAINGNGWIAVQTQEGTEAYTRAGDLRISPDGILQTGRGFPVIGNGGPIAIPPVQKIFIGNDGTISIIPAGENATNLAVIDRIKLVSPAFDQLEKRNDGLLHLTEPVDLDPSADVGLESGALEGSNVNAVEAMVNMIELARQFELQVKMMKAVEENSSAAAQLMRIT